MSLKPPQKKILETILQAEEKNECRQESIKGKIELWLLKYKIGLRIQSENKTIPHLSVVTFNGNSLYFSNK